MSSKAEAGHYSPSIGVSGENWFSISHLLPAIIAIVGAINTDVYILQGELKIIDNFLQQSSNISTVILTFTTLFDISLIERFNFFFLSSQCFLHLGFSTNYWMGFKAWFEDD